MSQLSKDDRKKLLNELVSIPLLQTYRGRRQLLESAGLEMVVPQMDLEGPPVVVVGEILRVLEAYGRVTYENEALGIFLNTVKEFIGPANETQAFFDRLMRNYGLMTPIKRLDKPIKWEAEFDPEDTLEKIIGENTLRNISFLERGLEVSHSVAFVDVGEWTGTGFMISPKLLITNNHILPDRRLLANTTFRLNYKLTFEGAEERTRDYMADSVGIFHTNRELDYTIVELQGEPGKDWGIAPLSSAVVSKNSRINIIQHPAGLPKQISFQNNFVEYADSIIIQYCTSTMNGSSGAPVFDDHWEVIALHHAGGMLLEPRTGRRYFRNEGIVIKAILEDLPDRISTRITQCPSF